MMFRITSLFFYGRRSNSEVTFNEKINKVILDNDKVISAEKMQRMGEVIALYSIITVIVRGGKDLHNLYKGLLRDIHCSKDYMSYYSDGYEIAQGAFFLCQHIGERLDDVYVPKTGRKITVKQAFFSVADRYLAKNYVALCSIQLALKNISQPNPKRYSTTSRRTIIPSLTGLYPK